MSDARADPIRLSQAGAVATIQLANPPGNRIDFAMRRALLAAVRTVARSDARVLVVRGDGADFCRGGDVREWVGVPAETLRPRIAVFADALAALRDLDIPTVAAVQGACMGGGFELALALDFIVAAESASFRFPEAASGILTLQGGALTLADRIGDGRALRAVLLAQSMSAAQLHGDGIVSEIATDGALDATVAALVDRLATVSPSVVAATKQLLRRARQHGTPATMAGWYDVSMPLFDQPATQAALAATARTIAAARPASEG